MLSTGPRTEKGKAIVSKNALKHGLLTEGMVILGGDGAEDPEEFARLLAGLRNYHDPVGLQEDLFVEEVAGCIWKARRANRAETGEIRRRLDTARADLLFEDAEKVRVATQFLPLDEARLDLYRTGTGLRYLLGILDQALAELQASSVLAGATSENLQKHFGRNFWAEISESGSAKDSTTAAVTAEGAPRSEGSSAAREALEHQRERLDKLLREVEQQDRLRAESRVASYHLPSSQVQERLLRYQTANNRQMYRAMAQLERLQRQRKGEAVPPAVRIEFAG